MGFFALLQNEHMKLYQRIGTWVMIILLIPVLIFFAKGGSDATKPVGDNWRAEQQASIQENKKTMTEMKSPRGIEVLKKNIAIAEYRLKHDKKPSEGNGFLMISGNVLIIINVFTIMVASTIVASEFSWGTIKLITIRPFKRWKLLLAKYLTTIIFSFLLIFFTILFFLLVGSYLFGYDSITEPVLLYRDGHVIEKDALQYLFESYGLKLINLLMITTLAFMISSIFRNQSVAIGISLTLLFVGGTVTSYLASKYTWTKYFLFANTNLEQYIDGPVMVKGMTLQFSITMLIIYYLIFVFTTWFVFNKRDITY